MVTIEQVRLLETKVTKAIDYVTRVTEENTLLKARMDGYQKRVEELEILIQRFKEDQGRIEEGIISALDKLSRFEDAVEHTLASDHAPAPANEPAATTASASPAAPATAAPAPAPEAPASDENDDADLDGLDDDDGPFDEDDDEDDLSGGENTDPELDIF